MKITSTLIFTAPVEIVLIVNAT